jgi:hypothetical protein
MVFTEILPAVAPAILAGAPDMVLPHDYPDRSVKLITATMIWSPAFSWPAMRSESNLPVYHCSNPGPAPAAQSALDLHWLASNTLAAPSGSLPKNFR